MANGDSSTQEKELPASEKRLRDAAAEGQVARSRDLTHTVLLGAFLLAMVWQGKSLYEGSLQTVRNGLVWSRELVMDPNRISEHVGQLLAQAFAGALPTMAILACAVAVAALVPGGFIFTLKPLGPNFSRVSPAGGLSRLMNVDMLIDLGKLLIFAVLLMIGGGWYTWSSLTDFAQTGAAHLQGALNLSFVTVQNGLWVLFLIMLAATLVDVPLQHFRHLKRLKMSVQEARDEHKEAEGDPQIKSRIRAKQQQISRARMLSDVPQADVIITNPSHYAVAVRYEEGGMGAPVVVAKGVDHLAARIREIGGFCEIPFVEAPPLARALYAHVEVGHEIPSSLYQAVAQVLAYVYQLRHWTPGQPSGPITAPQIQLPDGLDPAGGKP